MLRTQLEASCATLAMEKNEYGIRNTEYGTQNECTESRSDFRIPHSVFRIHSRSFGWTVAARTSAGIAQLASSWVRSTRNLGLTLNQLEARETEWRILNDEY